jgi:hypothetical protein
MDFENIDRIFDDAMKRTELAKGPIVKPMTDALAADHFLLKKSWDYFRERVKTIESHWSEIVQAKDAEIQALKEEFLQLKETTFDIEKENERLKLFEVSIRETRAEDFVSFEKMSERLKLAWQEERVSLELKLRSWNDATEKWEQEREALRKAAMDRETKLKNRIDVLEGEKAVNAQKTVEDRQKLEEEVLHVHEQEESWKRKVDLLKKEVESRDHWIKEQEGRAHELKVTVEEAQAQMKEMKELIKERDYQIRGLELSVHTLGEEKEIMKKSWAREQAEWRELWDRAREMWDKRNNKKES